MLRLSQRHACEDPGVKLTISLWIVTARIALVDRAHQEDLVKIVTLSQLFWTVTAHVFLVDNTHQEDLVDIVNAP